LQKERIKITQSLFFYLFLELLAAVKVPISILGAEIDQMTPSEVVKQFEEVLIAKAEVGNILSSKLYYQDLIGKRHYCGIW
jgi:hypothetical protein